MANEIVFLMSTEVWQFEPTEYTLCSYFNFQTLNETWHTFISIYRVISKCFFLWHSKNLKLQFYLHSKRLVAFWNETLFECQQRIENTNDHKQNTRFLTNIKIYINLELGRNLIVIWVYNNQTFLLIYLLTFI